MKYKFYVALDNIRSALNVGSIVRTCDAFNIDKLFLCGITPTTEEKKVLKTALGAEKSVNHEHRSDILELIRELKEKKFQITSLEQTEKSTDISKFKPKSNLVLILGNEVSGVSEEVLKESDIHIHIPMLGKKESLNVSVALGIAAFHITKIKL